MISYILRRLLQTVPVLLFVTLSVFAMVWAFPGDPARAFAGQGQALDDQQLELIRKEHHFDQPVPVQYALWLGKALGGDLGRSTQTNRLVAAEIAGRMQVTIGLGLLSVLLAMALGLPAGVAAALHRGRWPDFLGSVVSVGAVALPSFWLGMMLILVFSVRLGWLPVQGYVPFTSSPLDWLRHLLLPSLAMGISSSALITRQTRSAMLEVAAQDYVRTARAKGLSRTAVIWIHTLRNALLPVVTVLGMQVGHVLAGSVVIETLFGIPGMGRLLVQGLFERDFPIVQAAILVIALVVLAVNLLADLACAWLDPRVKYGRE